MLGIPVTMVGAEIQLEDAAFIVGLPCSGMNEFANLFTGSDSSLHLQFKMPIA